jgi:glycosyltransferase involved in cell wall biosynthesis
VIAGLREIGIPVHGLIVGGTHPRKRHYEAELRTLIREKGLSESITLLGHRSDLREIMAISAVVLSLSREPEAFGRVSLEALSIGRPVIGYDHGGVGEQLAAVFPEGLVQLDDLKHIIERIRTWQRMPPQVPTQQPFTLERMLTATLEVYEEAAAMHAARRADSA